MADYGIKISLPGVDVDLATPEECALHSGYPNLKIKRGADPVHSDILSYTFSSDPNNGTYTLFTKAHGYSYTPNGLVYFIAHDNNIYGMPLIFGYDMDTDHYQKFYWEIDTTNLLIKYYVSNKSDASHVSVNGWTEQFKYNIFVDKD